MIVSLLVCLVLFGMAPLGSAPVAPTTTAATAGTTVTILYKPTSPIVANASASFTAHITPYAEGRTISWYVNGGLVAQRTTNPNGIASFSRTFGAGGYGVKAILEPVDGVDRAESDEFLLTVTQDPARLPDRFFVERLERPTVGAEGPTAQIWINWAAVTPDSLWITATDTSTGNSLNLVLRTTPGDVLEPGLHTTDLTNAWVNSTGCGSGAVTALNILSMERDAAGIPISFALTFSFMCNADQFWPMVGVIRYNSTTPIPSLSLPAGSPTFSSVIEGQSGTPRSFSVTNNGDVPVDIATIAIAGPAASSFAKLNDECSGITIASGASCAFDVAFTPATSGSKAAEIVLTSDAGLSPMRLAIGGQALIAESVGQPVVVGELQYFTPGIRYEATISPNPQINFSECLVDGSHVDGSIPDASGVMRCVAPRPAPGEHTVTFHYLGSVFHGEATSPTTTFTVDPTTTTTITASAPVADAASPITLDAAVEFHGDVTYDGGTLTITDATLDEVVASGPVGPSAPSISVTRTFSAGAHHLVAEYSGSVGEDPSSASTDLEILPAPPDTTPPTATAPTWFVMSGLNLDAGRPKLRILWSGSDDSSGIDHFEIGQSTDGGPFVAIGSQVTPWNLNRLVSLGHTYRFRVRAIDTAGNVGQWAYGPTSRMSAISQSIPAVHYQGSWSTVTSSTIWWGGTARSSSVAGSTVSYKFTGRSITWVGVKARTRGKARIYVNGVLQATVDLWLSTVHKQHLIWQKTWSTSATRTITIKVLGTAGRPRVDIDGFIVGS